MRTRVEQGEVRISARTLEPFSENAVSLTRLLQRKVFPKTKTELCTPDFAAEENPPWDFRFFPSFFHHPPSLINYIEIENSKNTDNDFSSHVVTKQGNTIDKKLQRSARFPLYTIRSSLREMQTNEGSFFTKTGCRITKQGPKRDSFPTVSLAEKFDRIDQQLTRSNSCRWWKNFNFFSM